MQTLLAAYLASPTKDDLDRAEPLCNVIKQDDLVAALTETLAVLDAVNRQKPFGDQGHKARMRAMAVLAKVSP